MHQRCSGQCLLRDTEALPKETDPFLQSQGNCHSLGPVKLLRFGEFSELVVWLFSFEGGRGAF